MKKKLLKLSLLVIIGLATMPLKLLAQTGTADGTYNFSGTLGTADSGGPGFRTLGDKLKVSNAVSVASPQLYNTSAVLGGAATTVIKAEGGAVCKKFTLKTMSISAYNSTRTLSAFTITLKDAAGNQLATHSLSGTYALTTTITTLRTFLTDWPVNGYDNVSEISITAQYSTSAQTDLNFENMVLANISAASGTPPAITGNPSNNTICSGSSTSFSVTATNATSYQWQVNTGSGFTSITDGGVYTNATTATLAITGATAGMSGYTYRCVATGSASPAATSTAATLTVSVAPTVATAITAQSACAGGNVTFSGVINNASTYTWQVNMGAGFTTIVNGGVYSGQGTSTLTITGVTAGMNGYTYRLIGSGSCTPVAVSGPVALTVNSAPSITANPSSTSICSSGTTSFSATVSNATGYQWQVNQGAGFTNINNGGVYSGATTATLNITGATAGMNGYTYRVIASGACTPNATSTSATLTVNSPPVVTQNPFPSTICESDATLFYVAVSSATSYQWQVNTGSGFANVSNGSGSTGGIYSGATSSVLIINNAAVAMSGYTYRCVATGPCTPSATSSGATFTVLANVTYYEDYDNDGYGNASVTASSCSGAPGGFVANHDDCDDNDANVHPGAPEICYDGIDNNCDGNVDEGCVPLTQLAASDCNTTIEYLNTQYLSAEPVTGAEQYEFRITNGAYMATATDDLQAGKVRIIQFPGYQYGTTYQVAVRAKVAGEWGIFYSECAVTTTGVPHSEIDPAQCGATLPAMNTPIYTSTVNGATQYRFRIVNGANVQTIDRPSRTFSMTMLASYEYNTTYTIDVAVEFDGVWQPYSTACNVTTPTLITSRVVPSQCGVNLGLVSTNINAVPVAGATQYRFRIVNGANVQTIDKSVTVFKLTELASYDFSTTYTVDVAIEHEGMWQPYGTACNVTTPAAPTTQLQASQCGVTLPAINTYIYADKVSGAAAFRFRFTEGANVQTLDNPTRAVNMTMLATFKAGTTYAVEVAPQINGTWTAYGPVCNITTPGVPTQVKANQCGTTLAALNKLIYADAVTYATAYRFRVTNGPNVQTIDRSTNSFYLIQLASYAYGTTYTVEVAVQFAGIWQPYGASCNISTPAAASVLTSVEPAVCGTQVTDNAQSIPAQKVTGATQYEFLVENSGLGYSQSIVSNTFTFNFAQLTGLQTNTSYNVSVRTKVSGIWSPYGTPCSIRTFGVTPLLARNAKQQSVPVAKTGLAEKENDVNTLKITNLITPNGDGKNDLWIVEKIDQFPNNSVRIFNKAGRVIFTMKGYDNSWNATVNGTPIDEGTYYYLIDFGRNKLSKKGYITIVREETK